MELKDLVGEHLLDAVDYCNEPVPEHLCPEMDTSQVVRFRLDGVVYVAREDPEDGYRSCLGELLIQSGAKMVNEFAATRVVGTISPEGKDEDILRFTDCATGKVVLEVGTDYLDDYYPEFVGAFHPEALSQNANKEVRNAPAP